MKSFLQSDVWMEFQKSLGREVFEVEGTKIIKHDLPFGKNYLYVPYADTVPELHDLARREGSIFIKAEPLHDDLAQALVHRGFQKSSKNIQPHKTIILDLSLSEEEILGEMHHKTRYSIRVAERSSVDMRESNDIEVFWKLMEKTTKRNKFSSHPFEYYKKLLKFCKLFIAYEDDTPIAAAMILIHENHAYYLHGASDHDFRNLMAPYALHWHIIQALQAKRCASYDLWGIDAQKWPGVTRFKLGWGGRTVEYPGAFDLAISKPWYLAYTIYQHV